MGKDIRKKMLEESNRRNLEIRRAAEEDVRMIEEEIKTIKEQIAQGDSSEETAELLLEKEAQLRGNRAIAFDRD